MTSRKSGKLIKKSLPIFLLLLLSLGVLLAGVLVVFFQMQVGNYERALIEKEKHSLNLQRMMVRNHFSMIVGDLLFLAKQEELRAFLQDPSRRNLDLINSEYRSFSASKKNYAQIRYLDSNGMEVVRVNSNNGQPISIPKAQLQLKRDRYYFKDSFKLDRDEVFISPFDLNIERGKVEEPYKPMIRFSTPVFDQSGVKRGIVMINYLGQDFLDIFMEISPENQSQIMLVNKDGYWLSHPEVEKEWGFMFADRRHVSFTRQQPEIWKEILPCFSGQVFTSEGLYVFTTVSPLDSHCTSSEGSGDAYGSSDQKIAAEEYFWKIISFVSKKSLSGPLDKLKINLFELGGLLFLLGAVGAWFLAETFTRRGLYRAQLINMAHFDALTGLPNRTLFYDRLDQSLLLAKRYDRKCALLYVDLDGFKSINDTLGHTAGDELLTAVGQRMVGCCRTSDTIARLGGDEYAILLAEVADAKGAEVLAEQVLVAIKEPFYLKQQEAIIGASIGIAIFPEHGQTADQLVTSADMAMYSSKGRGKNTYTMA